MKKKLRYQSNHGLLWTCLRTIVLIFLLTCGSTAGALASGSDVEWQYRDAQTGKQTAVAAAVDPATGEMIITGYTDSNGDDYYTVKINATGTALLWTAPAFDINGGEDRTVAVAIDSEGNVIVTGHVTNAANNIDFHTVKYNGATGAVLWAKTYGGAGDDFPVAMAVDYLNNVYVGGFTPGTNGKDDGLIVKYSPDGSEMWAETYNNPADNDHDRITDITAGPDGIAFTGKTLLTSLNWDILTVKYDFNGTKLWDTIRPGTFGNDEGAAVAMDSSGNVIVTGTVLNATSNNDIYTVKYKGSDGTVMPGMEMTYADPNGGTDQAHDLVVDANGDIFITASTYTVTGMYDFLTVRYSGSDGSETWATPMIYSSGGDNTDIPTSLAVNDDSVVVTGYTAKASADVDFTTVKYDKDNGHELWPTAATYNNTAVNKDDHPVYVGFDTNGKIYVAGWSDKSSTAALDYDYYAIRYDPGALNTPTNLSAVAADEHTVNLSWNDNSISPNEDEYLIERKIGSGGTYAQIDTAPQDVTTYHDTSLTQDTIYYYRVRGHNTTLGEYSHYSPETYAKTTIVTIDTSPNWLVLYNGPDNSDDTAQDIAVGPDMDPVVTGFSTISNNFDYYTVKLRRDLVFSDADSVSLDLNGDGLADIKADFATSLAADSTVVFDTTLAGVVTPGAHTGDAAGNTTLNIVSVPQGNEARVNRDATGITLSWNSTTLLWSLTDNGGYTSAAVLDGYVGQMWDDNFDDNGNMDDEAKCLIVDNTNEVVVSGTAYLYSDISGTTTNDVYTRKYPSSGPPPFVDPFIWEDQYNGAGAADDYAEAISVVSDAADNVAVVGYGLNAASDNDIYVMYFKDDGTRVWAKEYDQAGGDDRPVAVTFDPDGDVIMTGRVTVGGDFAIVTRKYCSDGLSPACSTAGKAAGDAIWTTVHDSGNGNDQPAGVITDSSGDVYVAGFVTNASVNKDTYIVKLSGATGNEVWGAPIIENGPGNGDDLINAVKMDTNDDEFVVATTWNLGAGNNEFRMTRYTAAGVQVWDRLFDSPATDDLVQAMGMDVSGNFCVAGTRESGGSTDLFAVKYDYAGNIVGAISYDGGHSPALNDEAAAVAVNRYGDFFVAGNTTQPGAGNDYLVTLCEGDVLQAPAPFTATPYYTTVDFTWVNNAPSADGFTLEGKTGSCPILDTDATWQEPFLPSVTNHTETGLAMGETYCFRIKTSISATGEDSRWLSRQVTTSKPPAPANLSATAVNTTRGELSWTDGVSGEENFRIERCNDTSANCGTLDANFSYVGDAAANATSFDDPTACPGQTYTYRVRAANTLWGQEPLWAYVQITTPAAADPALTSVTANSEGRLDLAWTDGNADETGFKIYRCQGTGCTIDIATDTPIATVSAPQDTLFDLKMDETSWTAGSPDALDSSGNGNNGTTMGNAQRGLFDGDDDYITLGDIDALDAPGAFSVELRFRRDAGTALATNHQINNVLLAQSSAASNDNFEIGTEGNFIELYLDTAGNVDETKSVELGLAVDAGIQDNVWYHLVFTYDKDAADGNEAKLYLNGALLHQWSDPSGLLADSVTSPLTIGMARPDGEAVTPTGLWGDFQGEMDEAVVYNRALTATEVADYYAHGNSPNSYADSVLTDNTTYRYLVTAFKTTPTTCGTVPGWESTASGYGQATTTGVAAPVLQTAAPDAVDETTDINLSWQDTTEFEENFIVERCTGNCTGSFTADTSFTVTPNPGKDGTVNWTDITACSGTYTYRVKAVRTTAPAWTSATSAAELVASTVSPTAPLMVSATKVNEEEIQLNWTDQSKDETSFTLERCIGASCVEVSAPDATGTGSVNFTDTRLMPDTTYLYRVKAIKSAGVCSWQTSYTTPQISADTNITPPFALTPTFPNTTEIDLSWTDPTAHETGFVLERCNGDCTSAFTVDQTQALNAGVTHYADTSVCEGTQYSYRIRAISQDFSGGMNDCWTKRQKVTITPFTADTVIDFTVNYVAGMQNDFDDLRFYNFTDGTELDGAIVPYVIASKTDGVSARIILRTPATGDFIYMYYGNTTAINAPENYEELLTFSDDFQGTVIDTNKWMEIDPNGQISQNNGLNLNYVDTSWNAALISQQTFVRKAGNILLMKIQPQNGPSSDYFMAGWDIDQTIDPNFNPNMVHGLYWANFGSLSAYTKGSNRGYSNLTPYSANTTYMMKIVLKATGADYYLKGGVYTDWRWIVQTSSYADDPLRIGIHQNRHQAKIELFGVIEPSQPTVNFNVEPDVTCNILGMPHAWQSNNSALITPTTTAAAEPTSFTATPLSESEIKLTWQKNTLDEDGFTLERCQGSDAACVAVTAPNFDWSLPFAKPASTPKLLFAMDEASWPNTAGDVQDSSGNANHGQSMNGADTVADAERGKVGYFDGTNDYIIVNNSTSLKNVTDGSYTFEAWAKPADVPPATDPNPPGNNWIYTIISRPGYHTHLSYNQAQRFTFTIWNSTNQAFSINSADTFAPGVWYHVAGVVDNAQKIMFIYVDGRQQASSAYTGTLRNYGTNPYYVGVAYPGASYNWYFKGRIDDAAIYNYALSANELEWHSGFKGYTDTGLSLSTEYTYRVRAYKNSSSCTWDTGDTVRVTATTLSPPKPTNLQATVANTTEIDLVWNDHTTTNTAFEIERSTYNGSSWDAFAPLKTVGPDDQSYADIDACNDTQYKYRVRAVGEEAGVPWPVDWSDESTPVTTTAKITPTLNTVTRTSEARIDLSWTDTNTDETGFELNRCVGTSCQTVSVEPGTSGFSDAGLQPATTYCYQVRAVKTGPSCGWQTNYDPVAPLCATTDVIDPVLPLTVGATTDPSNTTQVALNWTDNSETESGFTIWRCNDDTQDCSNDANFASVNTAGPNQRNWNDNSVCSDKTYTYKIEAVSDGLPVNGFSNSGGGTWTRKKKLSFDTFTAQSTAFVTIPYDADMQADFDDLRFVNEVGTELSFTIDTKTNGTLAQVWFQTGSRNSINMYYGNPSATSSAVSEQTVFAAGSFYDDFQGTVIDGNKWVEIDPNGQISQNNALQLNNIDNSWNAALISSSKQTFARKPGELFYIKFNAQSGGSFMTGWEMNQDTDPNYTKLIYGIQIPAEQYTNLYTYSKGSGQSYDHGVRYNYNADYELKIELKANGAKYYIRGGIGQYWYYPNWNLFKETSSWNDTPLRVAISQQNFQAKIKAVAVVSSPAVITLGPEEGTPVASWNSARSGADSATTALYTKPQMDQANTTGVTETSIQIAWTDVNPDESYFRIYRGAADCTGFTEIGQTAGPDIFTFVDTGADLGGGQLAYNTTYCYEVQAHKNTGGCDWDTGFTTTATATTDIPIPTNLTATAAETTRIDLTWDDTTSSETRFIIDRCDNDITSCDADPTLFKPLATVGAGVQAYSDTTVCPETSYSYRVKADRSGEWTSGPSASAGATTPGPPVSPSNLALTEVYNQNNDTRKIDLVWTDTNPDEDGFIIERCNQTVNLDCDSADTNFSPIRTIESHDEFNTQIDPLLWSQYSCLGTNCSSAPPIDLSDTSGTAKIYDDNGTAALETTISAIAGSNRNSNTLALSCPASLGSGDLDIQFDWNLPSAVDRTTMSPNNYHIYLRWWMLIGKDSIIIDRDVRDYADYYWGGLWHNGVQVAPFYVSGTTDTAGKFRITRTGATLTLYNWDWNTQNWNILSSYANADIGSTPSAFQIKQSLDQREPNTTIKTVIDNFKINSGIVRACSDDSLDDSTDYYYRLRAFKETACPAWDNLYSLKEHDLTNPAAPTLSAVSAGSRKIKLTWVDNASDEDGYEIEKLIFGRKFVKIDEVAANTQEFIDTRDLNPDTTYTYRIRAYRDNYASYSAYSNEVSPKTDVLGGGNLDDTTCP